MRPDATIDAEMLHEVRVKALALKQEKAFEVTSYYTNRCDIIPKST